MEKVEFKSWLSADGLRPELMIREFYSRLDNPKVAIDLGANNGFHSLSFARCHRGAKVIAVEANITTYEELKEKVESAGFCDRVIPKWFAIQNNPNLDAVQFNNCIEFPGRSGILPFWFGVAPESTKGMTYASPVVVPATTVDKLVVAESLSGVDFIKADLEGGEYHAFVGSIDTLKKFRPAVVFERSLESEKLNGYDKSDWFKLFAGCDYQLVTFFGEVMGIPEYYDYWYIYAFPTERVNELSNIVRLIMNACQG